MLAASDPSPTWAEQASLTPDAREHQTREDLLMVAAQLDDEYLREWLPKHVDIINFVAPGRGEFWPDEALRGHRKDLRVLNNIAQDGQQKLTAALDTGVTSEVREWYVIGPENPLDAQDFGVREYCHEYQEALAAFISRVGFYAPNRNALADTVTTGTGLVMLLEGGKDGARVIHCPVGTYRLGTDQSGEVNLVVRRFVFNAHQMVREFGAGKCSDRVKRAISNKLGYTAKFTVLQIVQEREDREPGKIDAVNMPWASYWLEVGDGLFNTSSMLQPAASDAMGPRDILRESGYNERPFYCFRWDALGTKAYGVDSPGERALGDALQLQDEELNGATLRAGISKPPMNWPAKMLNGSILPGAENHLPDDVKVQAYPAIVIPPEAITVTNMSLQRIEKRIERAFYTDLLFLLSADSGDLKNVTAEAVRGKKEERLLQLGSVAQRVFRELRVALKRLAALAGRAGILPPPPPDMLDRKVKLRIEFNSPLLAAQKAVGAQGLAQVVSFGLAAAQAVEGGFDNFDKRKAAQIYADMYGVAPDVFFSDDEMAKRDQASQQKADAEAQAESLPQAAGAIKDLSNTDPDKLQQTLQRFSPAAGAQAGPPN